MRVQQKHINIGLLLAIVVILVSKIYYINRISFDIDTLDQQITPLKKYMRAETPIGYHVNTQYAGIYMAVQNVMAPRILYINLKPDTLIMIRDKTEKVKGIEDYQVIAENTLGERIVSLIKKIK